MCESPCGISCIETKVITCERCRNEGAAYKQTQYVSLEFDFLRRAFDKTNKMSPCLQLPLPFLLDLKERDR